MVKATKKWPKLKCKAAQTRAILPFAQQMAAKALAKEHNETTILMSQQIEHLHLCYECLSSADVFVAGKLKENSRKFALCTLSLESLHPQIWRTKAKMHWFQEMCEESGPTRPSLYWTYRDESFGGQLAKLAARKGGWKTPETVSFSSLTLFRAHTRLPYLK